MSLNTIQLNTYTTEGTKIKATITNRNHDILFDQPKERKGSDTAAKPTEVFLASLGACKLVVAKSFAKKHKINLKAVDITVEGEIDPKGFSQQDPEAKVGFSTLRTIFNIEADNTKEEIDNFIQFIENHCPVQDTIVNQPEFETVVNYEV